MKVMLHVEVCVPMKGLTMHLRRYMDFVALPREGELVDLGSRYVVMQVIHSDGAAAVVLHGRSVDDDAKARMRMLEQGWKEWAP